ncbi:hypothetical protein [Tardiphaga sp.]|uniref:hypothetical protein n=1 Tax=Tardiphaga sp. TaxID=1926292 RepID=UPI00261551B3|nr:hypothetical protein [Tardiphaga sp.]MDB5616556.1 hypothetical protein [Tardiphaga sp.]
MTARRKNRNQTRPPSPDPDEAVTWRPGKNILEVLMHRMARRQNLYRTCDHAVCQRAKNCVHPDIACMEKARQQRPPMTQEEHARSAAKLRRMIAERLQQLGDEEPDE